MLVALFIVVTGSGFLVLFILHPYISILFWLLYAVTYFNRPEKTGRWSQDWLRGLSFWKRLSSCEMAHPKMLAEHPQARKLLFLVAPNTTLIPMFWSFGLHGHQELKELDVVFTVPRVLLYIPILRDVLMMAGAVEDDLDTVKRLLSKGRAVCMCTGGLGGYLLEEQLPDESVVMAMPDELAEYCVEYAVYVSVVIFMGENGRYRAKRHPRLLQLQQVMYREVGYPFMLTFMLHPEVPVTTVLASPVSPRPYKERRDFKGFASAVHGAWRGIANVDDHSLIIKSWRVDGV